MLSLRHFWGFLSLLFCYWFSLKFIILTELWYFSTGQVSWDYSFTCLCLLIYGVCEIFCWIVPVTVIDAVLHLVEAMFLYFTPQYLAQCLYADR